MWLGSRAVKALIRLISPDWLVQAYRARHYARKAAPEECILQELCPRGLAAVDVGGNHGGYTWVLRTIASEVHTFEPQPNLVSHLRCAFLFDRRVHIYRVALSDKRGYGTLRIPFYQSGYCLDGLATIDRANTLQGMQMKEVHIETAKLDDYNLRDVGFIKIDVEGHELSVLQGAYETLCRNHPTLLIEAAERHRQGAVSSVRSFLEPLGYRGWFSFKEQRLDIERFDPLIHQRPDAVDDLGHRLADFTAEFVFS